MRKITSVLLCLAMLLSASVIPAAIHAAEWSDPSDTYTHTDAQCEDSHISLWFEYPTEKVKKDNVTSSGKESYTVYMAQNEIENAQFVMTADEAKKGLTATLSPMTDGEGHTLEADIYIELYQSCDNFGTIPDAIPPLSAYGDFTLVPGESQAFLVKVKTLSDSVPGWYESELTVKNSAGDAVKCAKVFVYVFDFALSEETACATSINLDYGYLSNSYGVSGQAANELYVNYYDYLLENRITAYKLPYQLYSTNVLPYMDNPRVTSFQMGSFTGTDAYSMSDTQLKRIYDTAFKDHPERFNKMYLFSNVVDAATPGDLERLKSAYDQFVEKYGKYQPEYSDVPFRLINTYINDIDYTTPDGTIDQIEYYKDFVNLWCSKTFAYTEPWELTTRGAKVLQPLKWDTVYGTFKERMAEKRAAGQGVWWFISWDVEAPYINYYMQTDGVAQRILFWQQFDNDVQGFLYNFTNFWITGDAYTLNITNSSYPDAHGESILIYPGNKYGLDTPVGSLRLEAMRDGIEDYQIFYMLENLKGEGAADKYIDMMTTGMVTYNTSDSDYLEARRELCKYTADVVNGRETPDTPVDPPVPETTPGDLNGDGKINASDMAILKKVIVGKAPKTDAADVDSDGKVTGSDAVLLKKKIVGKA